MSFSLLLGSGVLVSVQCLDFINYREIGMDIWGTKGRLSILQESLGCQFFPLMNHRALLNEKEVASDKPTKINVQDPLPYYKLYDNLADSIFKNKNLISSGKNCLLVEKIIDSIKKSSLRKGVWVEV